MIFVLHSATRVEVGPEGPESEGLIVGRRVTRWTWDYRQGTARNAGETLAVCPASYDSEREARSAIAKARKAFGGARMAKVHHSGELVPSDD